MSPLTGTDSVTLLFRIDASRVISDYMTLFKIDVRKYFRGANSIGLYKCNRTAYKFYHPFNLCGDSEFYSQLEKYPWYYMDTKWEYDYALKHIKIADRVLEIGAGKGSFLQRAMGIEKASCVGLELNQGAAKRARERGVNVLMESAEEHAINHRDEYDVICLFQILEHISNPASFLNSAMRMLKSGGRLIIAVPDNSVRATPSIFVTGDNILNMPPHHQGLWDIISLSSLQKILPIELEYMALEPATVSHHSNSYRGLMKQDMIRRFGPIIGFLVYAAGRPYYNHALQHLNKYLPAHSILAIYQKLG